MDRHGQFDTILALDVLEHLTNLWVIVEQLHKALRLGGQIVASIPNIRNIEVLLPLLLRNRWHLTDEGILDRTHLRYFVRDTAISLLTSSGLKLEAIKAVPSAGWKVRVIRAATAHLLDSFTDRQYILRVRHLGI